MGSSHGFRNLGNIRREINKCITEGQTVASIKLVETILYETESTGLFTKITRRCFYSKERRLYSDPRSTKSTFQDILTKLAIEKYISPTEQMQPV